MNNRYNVNISFPVKHVGKGTKYGGSLLWLQCKSATCDLFVVKKVVPKYVKTQKKFYLSHVLLRVNRFYFAGGVLMSRLPRNLLLANDLHFRKLLSGHC